MVQYFSHVLEIMNLLFDFTLIVSELNGFQN